MKGLEWEGGVEEIDDEDVSEDEQGSISKEVEVVAVRKDEKGKSAGMDSAHGEMIRKGAGEVAEWFVRMFIVC